MSDFEANLGGLQAGQIGVLGLPFDANSSFLRGPALAPGRIREALRCGSANMCAESGHDLEADAGWRDLGDAAVPAGEGWLTAIETAAARVLERGARLCALGGDHSVSWPLLRAHARRHPGLTILHLDAHPDLYDALDGNRQSNACPFARIMEEGLATRLVQVGIRTLNPHQRRQVERFGVRVIEARDFRPGVALGLSGPLYLSIDLDVLDPAFAPGVSHHEPGGLSTRDVLGIVQGLPVPLAGADIVELNPSRDLSGITAMLAAKLLKEILAQMLGGNASASA